MWTDVELAFQDGLHRVALAAAGFLPGVLTMLLVLGFALALAFLVRFAMRRSLAGIDFDRRVHRWGLTATGEWMPKNAPTEVAAHAGFWFVLLVGFLAGLRVLGTAVTDILSARILDYIPNLLAAGLIFAVGLAGARFLERTTLVSAVNMQLRSARLVSLGVKWLTVVFTVALALQELRVGGAILTISFVVVFAGMVLAVALAVGLSSRPAGRAVEGRANDDLGGARDEGGERPVQHM
jgi:hypothetical protein